MDRQPSNQSARAIPAGWQQLLQGYPWFEGPGQFPIPAYSEFMPPPRLGGSLLEGEVDRTLFEEDDPYGWQVPEIEEEYELQPGLAHIARQVLDKLVKFGRGLPEHHIPGHQRRNLVDNPCWPSELAAHAGALAHERFVALLPLALSKTQDDKGRVRWTYFGGSEQGPARAFWKSFYRTPDQEIPAPDGLAFFTGLLSAVYGEKVDRPDLLRAAGFRILPTLAAPGLPFPAIESLPSWTAPYLVAGTDSFETVRYLLTFTPFSALPAAVKDRYLSGALNLLPFPGSLVFWGMPTYRRLCRQLPLAMQFPLQQLVARNQGLEGLRSPQVGWLHQPHPDLDPAEIDADLLRPDYVRTHCWERLARYTDELAGNPHTAKMARLLFDASLKEIGLYDKPMARNCQLWTREFELLLDGPNATREQIITAGARLDAGGLFGYRMLFPAMRVGRYEVYWQRLLAVYPDPQTGEARLLPSVPPGYLTAYRADAPDLDHPVELWPRLRRSPTYLSALQQFKPARDHYAHQTTLNILNLLDSWQLAGQRPLPRPLARSLLRIANHETLEGWLAELPEHARDPQTGRQVQAELAAVLEPAAPDAAIPAPITYPVTADRAFEEAYWRDIQTLAQGLYQNKDNADCVLDPLTLSQAPHPGRDLESLGDYLLARHQRAIDAAGLAGTAVCGELPFHWRTDFDFPLFGGWKRNQEGQGYERNLLVVIPGQDRTQAVVMADHYDTAYMEDRYEPARGGSGVRLAAAGADDNHSATAVLLQAAPIFLKLAQEGRLARDVWLLHLTGEEFPSDCMGARHFCQGLIEKTLKLHTREGRELDLSGTRPAAVLVMDMIAHNRDDDRDIFQISPGRSPHSFALAWQAHQANRAWNLLAPEWNKKPPRLGRGRGQRSSDGGQMPPIAAHLPLFGEVRTLDNPQSSLYNTDGQIFSDIGAPVVLLMENYDINRTGYHDTRDTLENIDLDYGAAVAAIAIETAARAASD